MIGRVERLCREGLVLCQGTFKVDPRTGARTGDRWKIVHGEKVLKEEVVGMRGGGEALLQWMSLDARVEAGELWESIGHEFVVCFSGQRELERQILD